MELKVYSTVAGELPMLVMKGTPECFVPYSQALELVQALEQLRVDFARISDQNKRLNNGVEMDLAEVERLQIEYNDQWRKARTFRMERDALAAENNILRMGMKGDYDLDAWLEWVKQHDTI